MTIVASFRNRRPRYRGMVKGKKVYDFAVRIELFKPYGRLEDMIYPADVECEVISTDAASAANWAMENLAMPIVQNLDFMSVTVTVIGSRGGKTERHAGPESIVSHAMMNRPTPSEALF